jgi:hypothetical protein
VAALHAFATLSLEARLQIGREYEAHLAAEGAAKTAATSVSRPKASKVLTRLRAKAEKAGSPA